MQSLSKIFLIQKYVYLLFIATRIVRIRADDYPVPPDGYYCSTSLGFKNPAMTACMAAWYNMPRGSLPTTFSRPLATSNNYVQVPDAYSNSESNPQCTITIDLDGHSKDSVSVTVPWDVVREMTQDLILRCVTGQTGGMMTYGIAGTIERLLEPTSYDGIAIPVPMPAAVEQPDGSIDSVAFPPPAAGAEATEGGYSEYLNTPFIVDMTSFPSRYKAVDFAQHRAYHHALIILRRPVVHDDYCLGTTKFTQRRGQ